MIRPPPTAIALGPSDIRDFRRRQRGRRGLHMENAPDDMPHIAHDNRRLDSAYSQNCCGHVPHHARRMREHRDEHLERLRPEQYDIPLQGGPPQRHQDPRRHTSVPQIAAERHDDFNRHPTRDFEEEPLHAWREVAEQRSSESSGTGDEYQISTSLSDDHDGYTPVEFQESPPKDFPISTQEPSSQQNEDFHYGGFTGRSSLPQRSSPFVPDDASTPPRFQAADMQRLRGRTTLPRSPLFLSHNASSSPERRLTSSLTPGVVTRVANHNSPGIIVTVPARRPSYPQTRFRHQTNSFSFDSTERASAAYEQERMSSTSSAGSQPQPLQTRNLHEELRGSSLQSSRVTSSVSSSPGGLTHNHEPVPEASAHEFNVPSPIPQTEQESVTKASSSTNPLILPNGKSIYFSSPQLQLPPPFSTTSRSSLRAVSLPAAPVNEEASQTPPASPVREPSNSPSRSLLVEDPSVSDALLTERELDEEVRSTPPSGVRSPSSFLRTAQRFLIAYRSRSPSNRQSFPDSHERSPSTTPRPSQSQTWTRRASTIDPPQTFTPSRGYRVYNDTLSPTTQPQTPAHLPEARHQSRYHPSYTAPTSRTAARHDWFPLGDLDGTTTEDTSFRSFTIDRSRSRLGLRSRGTLGRSDSPTGLLDDGFTGLYGGRENGDDQQNYFAGVRFAGAPRRLWNPREERRNGRNMSQTPEREIRPGGSRE